ncbi:hypothetical protein ACVT81_004043 [Yersinia enterocolitica]|nr:hypothetical protein [Yersinia enterocolitica]HDM8309038.1 hypothetical protein [Yersinia enterocolitica]HDV7142779.1 hypothetical protein [Yersinia enterocolitica]HDW3094407.1 hypothetical protein [Yersinia enterocolitica]HDY3769236.1 hypothetical protein [Yersinia enterocolitica]
MVNSPTQVYLKQSASDEVLIRIKEMEKKISEKFSVEEGMSEVMPRVSQRHMVLAKISQI